MSVTNKLRACLDNHLNTASGIPPIAFSDAGYFQKEGVSYLSVDFRVTSRRRSAMGNGVLRRYNGLYSINVYTPENKGPGEGLSVADTLIALFDTDGYITFDGESVSIEYAETSASYNDSPFRITPVNIAWYSHST